MGGAFAEPGAGGTLSGWLVLSWSLPVFGSYPMGVCKNSGFFLWDTFNKTVGVLFMESRVLP